MIVRKDQTKQKLGEYLHKCAFSPSVSTFLRAIQSGHLQSWPGIDSINFKNILENLIPTAKGHLDQEQKKLQSTKEEQDDFFPLHEGTKTYEYASAVFPLKPKETSYADLTGRFPHVSSRSNEYIFVMYDYDSNLIQGEPIKNRQAKTIVDAWEKLHNNLIQHGHTTKNYILDNECSRDLKLALKKNDIDFELTPPHMHRRNAAERAIRTYKNHVLAGLATCDPSSPISEWDHLLPQATLTLNLLRSS